MRMGITSRDGGMQTHLPAKYVSSFLVKAYDASTGEPMGRFHEATFPKHTSWFEGCRCVICGFVLSLWKSCIHTYICMYVCVCVYIYIYIYTYIYIYIYIYIYVYIYIGSDWTFSRKVLSETYTVVWGVCVCVCVYVCGPAFMTVRHSQQSLLKNICKSMCARVNTCIYVYIDTHSDIHILCMCACMYVCIYIYIYIYIYDSNKDSTVMRNGLRNTSIYTLFVCIHTLRDICTLIAWSQQGVNRHVCIHIHMYVYIYIYTYTYMYVCMYVCM
jgi:hypothetical protein